MTTTGRAQTRRRDCPVCGEPVPLGFGRPKTYCSVECRRELARQRHELDDLEAQIVDARAKLADGSSPGTYYWQTQLEWLQLAAAEARLRVTEAMR